MSHPGGPPFAAATGVRLRRLAQDASPEDPAGWAIRHGIAPLLLTAGADDATGVLAASRRRTEMAWEALAIHLQRCLAALEAAGVPALVLKGAALALSHYPDPALRPMGDLDVLVSPSRWRAAARALEALDWTVEDAAEHGAAFAGPGGVRLELHGALTSCPGLFPITFDDLYTRSMPLGGGFGGRRLGDEDGLVHLALHTAFQHGFRVRLGQCVDFERLFGRIDGPRLLELAVAAGATRPLAASLALVKALLEVSPPAEVETRLGRVVPAPVRRWIATAADRPWTLLGGMGLARARWMLVDGAVCRARLVAGTLWPGRPDGRREVSPWKALARGRRLWQYLQAR